MWSGISQVEMYEWISCSYFLYGKSSFWLLIKYNQAK